MTCWVTWPADLRVRPDVEDVGSHLDRAIAALRGRPDILDAAYEHDQIAHVVTFRLCVRYGISHHRVAIIAEAALYRSLRSAGFDVGPRALVGPNMTAILRLIGGYPTEYHWGRH